jgi:lysozyme family protein
MSDYLLAIAFILKNEGGLSQNPHDKGGITNFGISLRFLKSLSPETLKSYGIFGEINEQTIIELKQYQASDIYHGEFWSHAPFEKIGNQEVANFVFDMAINMGISPAIKCLQRALWSVRKRRDLVDDGILGEKTLSAIQLCGFLVLPAMRSERAGYYRLIAQNNVEEQNNLNGWLRRAYEST